MKMEKWFKDKLRQAFLKKDVDKIVILNREWYKFLEKNQEKSIDKTQK